MPSFPVAALFKAFKRAGLLVTVLHKPGTAAEASFDAQWVRPDQLVLAEAAQTTEYMIEFQTADAPPLRKGDTLAIDQARYSVRERPQAQGDGTYTRALLDPA